jgi:hypothetical protein
MRTAVLIGLSATLFAAACQKSHDADTQHKMGSPPEMTGGTMNKPSVPAPSAPNDGGGRMGVPDGGNSRHM